MVICLLRLLNWGLAEVDSGGLGWLSVGLSDWGGVVVVGSVGLPVLADGGAIGLDCGVSLIVVGDSSLILAEFGEDYLGSWLGLLENLMLAAIQFDIYEMYSLTYKSCIKYLSRIPVKPTFNKATTNQQISRRFPFDFETQYYNLNKDFPKI